MIDCKYYDEDKDCCRVLDWHGDLEPCKNGEPCFDYVKEGEDEDE